MNKRKDYTNQRFGKLHIIEFSHTDAEYRVFWKAKCDCGNDTIVRSDSIKSGRTTSCGCIQKEKVKKANTRHGEYNTKLYHVWWQMKNRCNNKNHPNFHRYGGRGISYFSEWNEYESFRNYILNNLGEKPSHKHSIDRIDNGGNYEPGNLRWATPLQQTHNRG